jgi:hypothetical protein
MAIQMALIIGLGCWGGYKLDKTYPNKFHIWTIVLSLFSIFAALYVALKDFIKPKD